MANASRTYHPSHRRRRRRAVRGPSAGDSQRAGDQEPGQPPGARSRPAPRRVDRAHHRHGYQRRPRARPGGDRYRPADCGAGRRRHARPHHQRDRRAGRRGGPGAAQGDAPHPSGGAVLHRSVDRGGNPGHRHQGRRSARALCQGRQDRPVRRRRRRQDRDHHGTDQQHRQGARRLFGVRRRRRAHPRGQRSLSRDDRVRASTRTRTRARSKARNARWSTAR